MADTIRVGNLPVAFESDITSDDYFLVIDGTILKRIQRDELYAQIAIAAKGDKGDTGATGATGSVGATGAQGIQGIQGLTGATGATGATGSQGAQGQKGWSPILAIVSDGTRRVIQIADWTGGQGTKPATGQYISSAGLTSIIEDAVDIRGSQGLQGIQGVAGANGADGTDANQIDTIAHLTDNSIRITFTDLTTKDSDPPKRLIGWASYQDSAYTSGSPLLLGDGVKSTLPNNAATSNATYIPDGVTSFYNNGTQKITPSTLGDDYLLNISFIATPSALNMSLLYGLDIGTGTDAFQGTIDLPRAAGVPIPITLVIPCYALANFISNGGIVKLTPAGGNVQIHTIDFTIRRLSTG